VEVEEVKGDEYDREEYVLEISQKSKKSPDTKDTWSF
jgi:hypothetical protein